MVPDLKGMDIKDLVDIVILRYDHGPQFSSKMSVILGKNHFFSYLNHNISLSVFKSQSSIYPKITGA